MPQLGIIGLPLTPSRLAAERAAMLSAPALKTQPRQAHRVAIPTESLQHPLAVYDALLGVAA